MSESKGPHRGQHLIGTMLGSCRLEKLLGYGGSSAVFLAQQYIPERQVAIKVFHPRTNLSVQMQRDFYLRFLREAEAASQLDHPNILPIYSYGEQEGLPYIIMPYMVGGTLSEYMNKHGCLSLEGAQWYIEQIASALDYAHEHGCVHCDVKPANILLDGDGGVMLTDFGIARIMQPDTATGLPVAKAPETLMGTPDYISPEQALGQRLDGRSDVYSLGITLFYLLAGRLPFLADSNIAVALLQVHEHPPALSLLRADVSPYTDSVIHKALAKKPEDRFQTAREFSDAFTEAILHAGKVYQVDLSGQETSLLDSTARSNGSSNGRPRVLFASRPVVKVKPTRRRPSRFSRLFIAAALLFSIAIGAALAASFVTSHIAAGAPPARVQGTVPSGSGNVAGDDLAQSDDWPTGGAFFFTGSQYHIQNTSSRYVALALYADHQYGDFHLTITLSELHGSHDGADYNGVVFRSSVDQSHYYLFEIVAWGGGQYLFLRYDGNGQWKQLAGGSVASLLIASGASNTLTINAHGTTFSFLINSKSVGSPVTDSSKLALTTGEIGLYVEEQGAEVVFSHLYITSP
jgi:serine/threonine protein kinase